MESSDRAFLDYLVFPNDPVEHGLWRRHHFRRQSVDSLNLVLAGLDGKRFGPPASVPEFRRHRCCRLRIAIESDHEDALRRDADRLPLKHHRRARIGTPDDQAALYELAIEGQIASRRGGGGKHHRQKRGQPDHSSDPCRPSALALPDACGLAFGFRGAGFFSGSSGPSVAVMSAPTRPSENSTSTESPVLTVAAVITALPSISRTTA